MAVIATAAAASALVFTTAGGASTSATGCPSVSTSASVGYASSGAVGAPVATTPHNAVAHTTVRHARKAAHTRRHATSGPGQMPPYVKKTAADPACVPTPGSASGTAPSP